MELEEARAQAAVATARGGPPRAGVDSEHARFFLGLRKQFQRRRQYELAACTAALLGLVLMLVENEVIQRDVETSTSEDLALIVLKSCVLASTLALDLLLVLRYRCDGRVHQLQNAVPSVGAKYSFWRPLLLVLELLVCSFHIPPGRGIEAVQRGDKCYLVYQYPVEVLGVFMIVRLYLLARYVRSSSALYSQWTAFVGSLNEVDAMRPFFHFKAIFKLRPLHVLVPLTLLNTLLTAAIVRILERPVQAAFESYWKSVWFTIVTLSATGFGDYFPVTNLGRAFAIVGGMFGGVLLVALIQSLFFSFLDLSPSEKKVKYLIEVEQWEKATHHNAATLLQQAWRDGHLRRSTRLSDQRRLYTLMRTARRLRETEPTMELPLEDQVADMEDVVLAEVERLEAQKTEVLARIQAKAEQLQHLKLALEEKGRR